MGIRTDWWNDEEYDYDRITGDEKIDVQEMLSRQKSNTLWSNFSLKTKNEKLQELFDNINKNNKLSLLFKGIERTLSKGGKSFFAWDIFSAEEWGGTDKKVVLYEGFPIESNQTMRFAQQEEYAGIIDLEITSNQSGVKQRVRQLRTLDETQQLVIVNAIPEDKIPIDVFYLDTPKFLELFMKTGNRRHNYGVLSMKEMLNKNIIDFSGNQDYLLPDDYPVKHLRNMINGMLVFYKKEQVKNSTKWAGKFSSHQDMFQDNGETAKVIKYINSESNENVKQRLSNKAGYKKTILEEDYILSTSGSTVEVEKLQSTFDGEAIARAITSLMEIYFNGSGMDFSMQSMSGASQYVNDAGIQTQNRRTTETIKEAIVLREEQYCDIFRDIICAWFGSPDAYKEYEGQWEFKVLSNIVNEEQYSVDKIIAMKENGLMSNKVAIEKANKDMNKWDLEEMMKDIDEEQEELKEQEQELVKANYGE